MPQKSRFNLTEWYEVADRWDVAGGILSKKLLKRKGIFRTSVMQQRESEQKRSGF